MTTLVDLDYRPISRSLQASLLAVGMGVLSIWFSLVSLLCWFLVMAWPSIVGVSIGLIVAVPLFLARPRLPQLPKPRVVLSRSEAPELFRLIDDVSDRLGAPKLGILAFDGETNASTLRVGLRRRLAIVIGLPLWEALSPEERVALLGHEVAHSVNGDLRRSAIIGTSLTVLAHWHFFTYPGPFRAAADKGVAEAIAWALVAIPHFFLGLVVDWQYRVTLDNMRRAEFAADRLAADIAGTRACRALFERMMLMPSIDYAVRRAVRQGDPDTWDAIRRRFDELPEKERDVIVQVSMEEELSVDSTHPPTGQRLLAVNDEPLRAPKLLLDSSRSRMIDGELDRARTTIEPMVRARAGRSDNW